MRKPKQEKISFYDRTQAVKAMYDLKKQHFDDIQLTITSGGQLMLRCKQGFSNEYPRIEIDDIESWSNLCNSKKHYHKDSNWEEGMNRSWEYWWIFD